MTSRLQKRGYHHGDLRRALLETALDLVASEGAQNFNLREAARRIGVSSAAPYRHFADSAAVLTALAIEGHQKLESALTSALEGAGDDPATAIRAVAGTTARFAAEHSALFSLMSMPEYGGAQRSPQAAEILSRQTARLQSMVLRVTGEDSPPTVLAARALVYGLARVFIDGQVSRVEAEEAERLAREAAEVFVRGLVRR